MSAKILDIVAAWGRRGRHVPRPAGHAFEPPETSTVGAKARTAHAQRRLVVDVYDSEMETLGKLVFTPELARDWGHFFSAFANRCSQEDAVRKRAAEGLCGSPSCKRKLVAGTERCRKCGEQIAARAMRGARP